MSVSFFVRVHAAELSQPTNGVYLAVAGYQRNSGVITNAPIPFDASLVFLPYCDTGHVTLSYPLDPAYGVKVRMTGPDGKEVQKTSLGKRFGSKFDRLQSVMDTRLYPVEAWGAFRDNEELGGAKTFPNYRVGNSVPELTPKDIFEMKNAGTYTLEIQMQMFRFSPNSTNAWNREVFRFSPVKIGVEKPVSK